LAEKYSLIRRDLANLSRSADICVQKATSTNIPTNNNLTPAEKGPPKELKERDDIVIKSADKGSAIVVMDKVDYLEEANRQLMEERFYKKLDSDPTEEFSTKITQELKIMKVEIDEFGDFFCGVPIC
jgi:hypothetical protein